MIIRVFLGILIFIAAIFYLTHLNQGTIDLSLLPGKSWPVSVSLLVLSSVVAGAFLMMGLVALRDTKRGIVDMREKARIKKKEKIMELYREGVNHLLSKNGDEALKSFQKILDKDPKHMDALVRMGDVYRYQGNYPEAIRYHNQARALDFGNLSVLFALGKDFRRAGLQAEAVDVYQSVLKIDERNVSAFLKLRELYEQEGDWEKLCELQQDFWNFKKDPEEKQRLHGYQLISATHLDPEKDRDKAVRLYSDLLKTDKSLVAPYVELGKIYKSQGQDKEALKIWNRGFKETGATVFLEMLDRHYLNQEDPASIIKIHKEAVARFPENPAYKFLLGKLYYRLEMIDDAQEIFEGLVHQGVQFPIMRQILGDLYYKRGRTEDAMEEFKKSVDFKRPIFIPYACGECGHEQREWMSLCTNCHRPNTLSINLNQTSPKEAMPSGLPAAVSENA
jgi:lipopolysaccharide biosynthesis regulator YciM